MYRLSIDRGGTFTDFTMVDSHGMLATAKVPSSHNVTHVLETGLEILSGKNGLSPKELLSRVGLVIHGTTVAVNTLLQPRRHKTGLICTNGFRDSLEIRLGYRDKRYDFTWTPPPPLVPRYLRIPVRERVNKDGHIQIPLNEEDVVNASAILAKHDVEAIAVCFLWSFLNPSNERRVRQIIEELVPGARISLSSDVCPEIREYDRVSTTVVNAYISQSLGSHLDAVEGFFRDADYDGEIRYLQSSGGMGSSESVKAQAISALNSGPAAGPVTGGFFANLFGHQNTLTIDIGGTSFDTCVLPMGHVELRNVSEFGGYRVRHPSVDVQSIGAGGGSIAWVDRGILRVGPHSAEAEPGPACYGKGGKEPTVTDADVVLGYLNPKKLLGGRLPIKSQLAKKALSERIARPLGISADDAATGIVDLVSQNMADAIRRITLAKGYDPRDYVLVAGGGAGPVHACELAQVLGIKQVIIPKIAAEFCSFGGLISDLRHDYRKSCISQLQTLDMENLRTLLCTMETDGRKALQRERASSETVTVTMALDMRYKGQVHEIPVAIVPAMISGTSKSDIETSFHNVYHGRYHFSQPGHTVEVVNARVTVIGQTPPLSLRRLEDAGAPVSSALLGHRNVLFRNSSTRVRTPIYDGPNLRAGHIIDGQAIIEEPHTTVVVYPGWRLEVGNDPAYVMTYTVENGS